MNAWEEMTLEEKIARIRVTARRPAMTAAASRPWLYEDALQEATITAWEVLQKWPDAPLAYVLKASRNGALNVGRGSRQTGAPERTKFSAPVRADDSLDVLTENSDHDDFRFPEALTVDAPDVGVLDVRAAVAGLDDDDRLLVWLRFWEGRTERDAATVLGISRSLVSYRWRERIEPALRSALAAA